MKNFHLHYICIIGLFFYFDGSAAVGTPVEKLPANFIFDGSIGEGEWEGMKPNDLTVQSPNYRGEPSERTEIRIAFDENYVYLSGALYDSEPDKILANTFSL